MAKRDRPGKGEGGAPHPATLEEVWREGKIAHTPEGLQDACNRYFADCDEQGRKYTRPGLALYLGIDTDTLSKWGKNQDGTYGSVCNIINSAMCRIQDALEQRTDSMAVFLLKQPCYLGHTDKSGDSAEGSIHITIGFEGGKGAKTVADYGK